MHGRNAEEWLRPDAAHYTQKPTQNAEINPEVLGLEISEEETEGTLLTLLLQNDLFSTWHQHTGGKCKNKQMRLHQVQKLCTAKEAINKTDNLCKPYI